jgi:hypothetical protein
MYEAAARNDLEDILACVSQGVDTNWHNGDDHQRTALHAAAAAGSPSLILLRLVDEIATSSSPFLTTQDTASRV